jgi:hypothetical protein
VVLLVIIIAGLGAAGWYFKPRFESEPPKIQVLPTVDVIGLATPLEIIVTDEGAGLRSVRATLTAGGAETMLASEEFAHATREKRIAVDPSKLKGVKEGAGDHQGERARLVALEFLQGNEASFDRSVIIDITPPTLELVADDRYINFGGVGALVYKVFRGHGDERREDRPSTSSRLQGRGEGQARELLRALRPSLRHGTRAPRLRSSATDKAGNTRTMAIAYELKNVKYKQEHDRALGCLHAEQGGAAHERGRRPPGAR